MTDTTAIDVSGVLQREAWAEGVLPPVEQVRDDLWSVPVPLPHNPLRYVLVYLLGLPDGVAMVDTGWDTPEAWAAIEGGLATAGYAVGDVRGVLVTHIHPDHFGLAGAVQEASGAWIGMHEADAALVPSRYADMDDLLARGRAQLADAGVPEEDLSTVTRASTGVASLVRDATPDRMLADGEPVGLDGWDLRAIWTPGHSPGHLCFVDRSRRLILSGDHVLPRISPNISVHAQQPPNPLALYLESLQKVRNEDVDEVLPGHEYRFRELAVRVDQLIAHHEERADEILAALDRSSGSTCWDLARGLTWSRGWGSFPVYLRRAAVGETLAHLVLLESEGRVVQTGSPARWSRA